MLRRRRREPEPPAAPVVDLSTVAPRWQPPVQGALDARERFRTLVGGTSPGPVRDRLEELGGRIDAGLRSAVDAAARATTASAAVGPGATAQAAERLKEARRRLATAQSSGAAPEVPALEAEVVRLAEDFASLNRLLNGFDDLGDRLQAVRLRLEGLVARAAELSMGPLATGAEADLDAMGAELTALQEALTELR